MAARTIWKGSISFGLVNIPVQVFAATQKEEFSSFNQLDEKGHKIKYKKWCPIEEREVPWSEIKKGYEISKNNYVILEKEDLENIKLKTTHTIEINEFIDSKDFDPLFIEPHAIANDSYENTVLRKIFQRCDLPQVPHRRFAFGVRHQHLVVFHQGRFPEPDGAMLLESRHVAERTVGIIEVRHTPLDGFHHIGAGLVDQFPEVF